MGTQMMQQLSGIVGLPMLSNLLPLCIPCCNAQTRMAKTGANTCPAFMKTNPDDALERHLILPPDCIDTVGRSQ